LDTLNLSKVVQYRQRCNHSSFESGVPRLVLSLIDDA
jgi:hypothetical protein